MSSTWALQFLRYEPYLNGGITSPVSNCNHFTTISKGTFSAANYYTQFGHTPRDFHLIAILLFCLV